MAGGREEGRLLIPQVGFLKSDLVFPLVFKHNTTPAPITYVQCLWGDGGMSIRNSLRLLAPGVFAQSLSCLGILSHPERVNQFRLSQQKVRLKSGVKKLQKSKGRLQSVLIRRPGEGLETAGMRPVPRRKKRARHQLSEHASPKCLQIKPVGERNYFAWFSYFVSQLWHLSRATCRPTAACS